MTRYDAIVTILHNMAWSDTTRHCSIYSITHYDTMWHCMHDTIGIDWLLYMLLL